MNSCHHLCFELINHWHVHQHRQTVSINWNAIRSRYLRPTLEEVNSNRGKSIRVLPLVLKVPKGPEIRYWLSKHSTKWWMWKERPAPLHSAPTLRSISTPKIKNRQVLQTNRKLMALHHQNLLSETFFQMFLLLKTEQWFSIESPHDDSKYIHEKWI